MCFLQKTTLISALTLDAFYGKPTGSVTLNGVKLTDSLFKQHCYVMKQHDKHWPYLSCRETLLYCGELYHVAATEDIPDVVDEIIEKMGLNVCADTRCARLSGGQQRRLSIGIALLKQVGFWTGQWPCLNTIATSQILMALLLDGSQPSCFWMSPHQVRIHCELERCSSRVLS